MAVTQNSYIGNGSTTTYSFTFPYLKASDVKASIDAVDTTAFTLPTATTIQFNTAPSNGAKIKIFRETATDNLTATFYAGSAIKSEDLNENFTQNLYSTQEISTRYLSNLGGTMVGNFGLGEDADIVFEGATDNANETTITVADPTADRTITFPDTTGTVVTTGDTGTVTSTMLADGTIAAGDLASDSVTTAKIVDSNVTTAKIAADAVTGAKIADDQINSEHYVAGSIDTEHIANSQITNAKMADNSVNTAELVDDAVTAAKLASNSVVSASIVDGSIATADIADNAITNAKMADDSVGAAELVDTSVGTAALASNAVTNAKMADASVGTSELVNDAVTTVKIANSQVTTAKIADSNVTTAKINNDAVTSAKIADNAIGNEHLQDDSVRTAEIQDSAVTTAKVANSGITTPKLADSAVTAAKLANGSVTNTKIANNSISTSYIIDTAVTANKIASNAVTTDKIADAELTTLAGMQSGTASVLASSTALTATTTELNQLDGKTIQTTVADNDAQLPTSGAIVDYVAAQIAPLGGLEVIATEVAFPNTQPASGVVISISDAGGIVVNGSGVSTTGRTVGGSTVTINGFPSSVQSSTLAASMGLMVSSTGSSQTYTYHKLLGKESDIVTLSDDINDFNNRYRVSSSAPTSSLDNGDLWFDTTNGKMMVYNTSASAWEEVSAIGSFNINTLSSSGSTGGGSATFNGTAYRFTLSNPPQDAQQLLVSINGVVQKPNSGSSQPSEGFAISGNDIIFSAAPASGSISFIVTLGQSVQIGTPSDNTISTAKIQNLAVTGEKVATNLDLADNKKIRFGTGNDFEIYHNGTHTYLQETGPGALQIRGANLILDNADGSKRYIDCNDGGSVELYHNGTKKFETTNGGSTLLGNLLLDSASAEINLKAGVGTDSGAINWTFNTTGTNYAHLSLPYDTRASLGFNIHSAYPITFTGGNSNETLAKFNLNGSVDLYYDNSKKFETTSSGATVSGELTVTSNLLMGDGDKLRLGDSNDLELHHSGGENYIQGHLNQLYIRSAQGIYIQPNTNENAVVALANGETQLFYDNSAKIKTKSYGATVIGKLYIEDGTGSSGSYISLGDNNDFKIYHDGTDSHISNTTGGLQIEDTGGYLRIKSDDIKLEAANGEDFLECDANGAVSLYYDATKKFETTTNGIKLSNLPDNAFILLDQNGRQSSFNNYFSSGSTGSKISVDISTGNVNGTKTRSVDFWPDGMSFNGDTAAANRIDDYEEGTWTPSVQSGGGSMSTVVARYTKIGRLVHVQAYVNYTTASSTNAFQMGGLPFACLGNDYNVCVADFGKGGKKGAYSRTHTGNTFMEFLYSSESASSDRITLKGTHVGTGYIIVSNTYMTS